jgi:hypothetical protein
MKIFRLSALLFVSLALIVSHTRVSKSCASDFDDDMGNPFFFFDQTLVGPTKYASLLYTPRQLYTNEWYSDSVLIRENVNDWIKYSDNKPSPDDVEFLIYGLPEEHPWGRSHKQLPNFLELIRPYVLGTIDSVNDSLWASVEANSWIRYWRDRKDTSTLDYLSYAKTCEPYVTYQTVKWLWSQQLGSYEGRDSAVIPTMDSLIRVGRNQYDQAGSPFLKLRYAYQVVRLAHYSNQFDRCVNAFDSLVKPLNLTSPIASWALCNKAGALLELHREAEAAYEFSRVFEADEGRRFTSHRSFRIRNDSTWQKCLELCRNNREKIMLYFLRGNRPNANALEEMMQIHELDPKSELLEILLAREIAKSERWLLGMSDDGQPVYDSENQLLTKIYVEKLQGFIEQCLKEGSVRKPELWTFADGYCGYLCGDLSKARAIATQLKKTSHDEGILAQAQLMELAMQISEIKTVDHGVEDGLYTAVDSWLGKYDASSGEISDQFATRSTSRDYILKCFMKKCAQAYELQGDKVKAYLSQNRLQAITLSPSMPMLDGLLELARKKNKTPLEEHLLSDDRREMSRFSRYDWDPYTERSGSESFLHEVKATLYLAEDSLDQAIKIFQEIQSSLTFQLSADPFAFRIRDCRDCDFSEFTGKGVTKLELAQRLLELKKKIEQKPDSAAYYHFLLGNAYYNMTHFGNASEAVDYYRNPGSFAPETEYLDCSRSRGHYDEGMRLAEARGDSELAAKCCFMAAKCEQNAFYISEDWDNMDAKNTNYRTYFRLMKKQYAETEFYKDAISECEYFRYFVSKY